MNSSSYYRILKNNSYYDNRLQINVRYYRTSEKCPALRYFARDQTIIKPRLLTWPFADILFAISKPRLSTRLVWGRIMKKSFSNEVFIHLMITSYRLIVMILCIRKEGFVKKRCSQSQEMPMPIHDHIRQMSERFLTNIQNRLDS